MSCRLVFIVSAWLLCSVQAWGGFVEGVESFDGAIKDTETWEEFTGLRASILQDDVLSMSAQAGFSYFDADYTTRGITIGVGESVSVEILVHVESPSSSPRAVMALTANEWGTQRSTLWDSHFLFAGFLGQDETQGSAWFGDGGNGGMGGGVHGHGSVHYGEPYVYRIDRLEQTLVHFSVLDMTGRELASEVREIASPNELYITLWADGAYATFDNVDVKPEPATVRVGNPGNANDTYGDGYGGVDYVFNIGKYEVTAGQYTEFLNAVAATDTYGLYSPFMVSYSDGCQITQNGEPGSYTYDFSGRPSGTEADWIGRSVNLVSWGDAARFANWLHNGQPTGAQDLTTTEDGSYYLDGATRDADLLAVTREHGATWVIPSEDEWYKAAYYYNDGVTEHYYDYPTYSNRAPSNELTWPDIGYHATFFDGGYTIGSPYYRTTVAAHRNSYSPYGTFDQGGNVWEWMEDAVPFGSSRGIRGGSFEDDFGLHAADRDSYYPALDSVGIGFRVAEVPQSKSDIDFDGDVDLYDYGFFQDVGLHDYALLQVAFTGAQ